MRSYDTIYEEVGNAVEFVSAHPPRLGIRIDTADSENYSATPLILSALPTRPVTKLAYAGLIAAPQSYYRDGVRGAIDRLRMKIRQPAARLDTMEV